MHSGAGGGAGEYRRRQGRGRFIAAFSLLFFLAGCGAGQQVWYSPGGTQAEFDRDAQECGLIGREMSRHSTMTGREDPEAYASAYGACLGAKGWSRQPPVEQDGTAARPVGEGSAPAPAVYDEKGTVMGFCRRIEVPAGFRLERNSVGGAGAARLQSLFFVGPDNTYLNLLFQKTGEEDFLPVDFPVVEPFFLYEAGGGEKDAGGGNRWALSAGRLGGEWVAVLGGYIICGRHERITVVVSAAVPKPESKPPPGLHLDKIQREAVERFRGRWLPWFAGLAAE